MLLCIDVSDMKSINELRENVLPAVQASGTPFFLVGTKVDQRAGASDPVSSDVALDLKLELNSLNYYEVSSVTGVNVDHVFYEASGWGSRRAAVRSRHASLISLRF